MVQIVLAELSDTHDPETGLQFTIKRLAEASDRFVLKPANPEFEPLVVTGPSRERMRVVGVLIEVLEEIWETG